jgi:hypothetical protein
MVVAEQFHPATANEIQRITRIAKIEQDPASRHANGFQHR